MSSLLRNGLLVAFTALGLSCGGRGGLYTQRLAPLPQIATAERIVTVVPQTRRAVVIRPGDEAPVDLVISEGARAAERLPGREAVAVLGGMAHSPRLDLIDLVTNEVHTLELPGAFDRLAFSPDARVAVLTYAAEQTLSGLAARNLNELAVVNLIEGTVTRVQLDTESLAPRSVVFGPAEPGRQLVAIALDRGVAIFDALKPQVPPRRVSVRPQGSTLESTVLEALFSPTGRFLYLRASRLDDVIAIELEPAADGSVSASINFLAGGTGLVALAVPPGDVNDTVLALYAGSREVLLLDARGLSTETLRASLPEPLTRLHALPGGQVLAYDGAFRSVVAWDLTTGQSGSAVLDASFDAVLFADSLAKAVFRHQGSLSIVTIEQTSTRLRSRIQSIQLAQKAGGMSLDETGGRLFFSPVGSTALVRLDLNGLALEQATLDGPVQSLAYLPQGDWIAAAAQSELGDLTFLPAGTLARNEGARLIGYTLSGDLDRPEDP